MYFILCKSSPKSRAVPNNQIFEYSIDGSNIRIKTCSFHNKKLWILIVISPHHPYYHVAQLPIGGLRISNIRSKSKSKYPVAILFKNAQHYPKVIPSFALLLAADSVTSGHHTVFLCPPFLATLAPPLLCPATVYCYTELFDGINIVSIEKMKKVHKHINKALTCIHTCRLVLPPCHDCAIIAPMTMSLLRPGCINVYQNCQFSLNNIFLILEIFLKETAMNKRCIHLILSSV